MMSSNTSDPVDSGTGAETASPAQNPVNEAAPKEVVAPPSSSKGSKSAAKADLSSGDAEAPAPIVPAYNPNYKYKAFGNEKELDEFWRPLVKDQDSEKKVKDLFTRADAFDDLKTRHESTQSEFNELVTEYTALDKDVRKIMNFRNSGDLDNFFASLKIPKEQIFKWVEQKLELQSLPPEQRHAIEMQAQERQQRYDLEQQHSQLEQQYQNQAVQARTMQLDMTLSRPDVSSVASAVDSRLGRIGAFRDLVVEEAQKVYFSSGRDLSAEEATQQVMQKYGKLFDQGPGPQAQMQTPVQMAQVNGKPVIPAVQGKGTSPIKKAPKSIDDLRAMSRELSNNG